MTAVVPRSALATGHGRIAPVTDASPSAPVATGNGAATRRGGRDAALDLLRAVSLVRVVVWHVVGAAWLTTFAAIPLMFFVAGTLLPTGGAGEPWAPRLLRRARRLLVPLWCYGAVVAVAGVLQDDGALRPARLVSKEALWRAATWVVPLVDPEASTWHAGHLSTHLWYVRAYLWVLLLAPLISVLARHIVAAAPLLALAGAQIVLAPQLGLEPLASGTARLLAGDLIVYGSFAVLGAAYAHHRPRLPRPALAAAALAAAAGALVVWQVVGLPAQGVNASYPAIALLGGAWLCAAGAAEPWIRRVAEVPSVARATEAVSRRAVTIYLWHPAALLAVRAVAADVDVPPVALLPAVAALTALAVLGVGWAEDLGARRSTIVWSAGPRALGAVPLAVLALAIAAPAVVAAPGQASVAGGRALPPPPSAREALADAAFGARGARPSITAPQRRAEPLDAKRLQAALRSWLAAHPSVGAAAVSLHVGDEQRFEGRVNVRGHATIAPEEAHGYRSATKTFTIALTWREVAAGRLALDEPAPQLSGMPRVRTRPTVRQLLEHTSGLVDTAVDGQAPTSPQAAVAAALRARRSGPPGREVAYANVNALYLGLLLEQLNGGRAYADLVDDLVRPLGLTSVGIERSIAPGQPIHASGGARGTLRDLATWGTLLVQPGAVVPASVHPQMTSLGEHNLAGGLYPLCPCWTDAAGVKRSVALGQYNGFGGVYAGLGVSLALRTEAAVESDAMIDLFLRLFEVVHPKQR